MARAQHGTPPAAGIARRGAEQHRLDDEAGEP
jgi:hypothetical protein